MTPATDDNARRVPMLDTPTALSGDAEDAKFVVHQAQSAAYERMTPAHDLIITSSALLGGFAISAALDSIQEDAFGNQASFDAYAILLVTSSILDLYAVVALVFNRFLSLQIFHFGPNDLRRLEDCGDDVKDTKGVVARLQREKVFSHVAFLRQSWVFRASAFWAFVLSLPCFLGVLAAKQFSVQPMRAHRGAAWFTSFLVAAANPPPPPLPPAAPAEPFTPIRWLLASLVFAGMFAVLVAIFGQLLLCRRLRF